jgi:hypothetical protein
VAAILAGTVGFFLVLRRQAFAGYALSPPRDRPGERSEAILQDRCSAHGLLRRHAPRKDGAG